METNKDHQLSIQNVYHSSCSLTTKSLYRALMVVFYFDRPKKASLLVSITRFCYATTVYAKYTFDPCHKWNIISNRFIQVSISHVNMINAFLKTVLFELFNILVLSILSYRTIMWSTRVNYLQLFYRKQPAINTRSHQYFEQGQTHISVSFLT